MTWLRRGTNRRRRELRERMVKLEGLREAKAMASKGPLSEHAQYLRSQGDCDESIILA